MKLTVQTPDFKAPKKLIKFVRESVVNVTKNRDRILEGHVTLKRDKSSTQEDKICELRLVIPGNDLFVSRRSETFEGAFTECIHAIKHQIGHWEDSIDKGKRRGSVMNNGVPFIALLLVVGLLFSARSSRAHCDTMDGPVVAAAVKAIAQQNVNHALIWVQPEHEQEIKEAFNLTMKVRVLGPDARKLADKYFFETLVRVHRNGEGVAYTGIKPSGTPVDKNVLAADQAIASGDLAPLKKLASPTQHMELKELFDKAMLLKSFDVNDVSAGRRYVEAYVRFFHFAEAGSAHHSTNNSDHSH
ncbi:MAG TPA: DUF6448 family protein [Chryseosolibacter sp.]|nr:DUF6448 family protein [Chryseosolibacter sp.]